LLDTVRLPAHYAWRPPRELSDGEPQRVALARVLATRPAVLVCDEITAVTQAAVLDLLAEYGRDLGLSIVLITHNRAVAENFADDIRALADGRLSGGPVSVTPRFDQWSS
jgi:peptide/nickel transport system ATP-binding protein